MNIIDIAKDAMTDISITSVLTFSAITIWKFFLKEFFKKFINPVEFSKKWAYEKGLNFGKFYKKRIKNSKIREKTIKDLEDFSDEIQNEFIKGLKAGSK